MKKIIKLYNQEDIFNKKDEIIRHNAFIAKDGTFYLAKGYTGCNPSHQLDSSALLVGRKDIGFDFKEKYQENYKNIEHNLITYTDEEREKLVEEWNNLNVLNKCSDNKSLSKIEIEYRIKARQKRVMEKIELMRLRSILVHYYGYVLFAMKENIDSKLGREKEFFDESMIPNPEYYGMSSTNEQIKTLEELFYLNCSENYAKKRLFLIENHLTKSYYWNC